MYGCKPCSLTSQGDRGQPSKYWEREHVDVKRDKIRGFRKLQSEGLHNFFSTNKVGMIKSRQIIWAWHVTCILKKTV
jgi:hypothetical protein